jgi:ABC-type dipeptide/oligopeptide/nickel transport system permease component
VRLAKAIVLRLLYGLISLFFIVFVAFIADEMAPGDAATVLAGEKATPMQVQILRHNMGLDRPWPTRFGEMLVKLSHGDLGDSLVRAGHEPVSNVIKGTLPLTALNAGLAMLLAILIGVTLGTMAGVWENRFGDRAILLFSTLGVTLPNFVLAPILVYIFALRMDVLPQTWAVNRVAPIYYYLLLPVVVLSLRPMALLTRLTRASMIETMNQEFIRLAIAKGVPSGRLIFVHALRNAILPVFTAIGTSFGFLLTGSFVVERFFTIPGMGSTAIEAITNTDGPVIIGTIIVSGFLFIAVNLIVDLVLPLIDPRIREAQI